MPRNVQGVEPLVNGDGPKKTIKKTKKKATDDTGLFASYLPSVCKEVFGNEVTMSGKTCRSLSALLGSLETMLTADAKRMAEFQQKKSILPVSVQVALTTRLPRSLTEHAAREGSNAVVEFQKHQKVKAPKAPKKNGLTGH